MRRIGTAAVLWIAVAGWSAAEGVGWRTDGTGRYPDAHPPVTWSKESNVVWRAALPSWGNATPVVWGERVFVLAEPDLLLCVSAADGSIRWQQAISYENVLPPAEAAKIGPAREKEKEVEAAIKPLQREAQKIRNALKKNKDDAALQRRQKELNARIGGLRDQLKPLEPYLLPSAHNVNGYTSATPVCDGRRVYVVLGTGAAAAFDLNGNRLWARIVGRPTARYGHSASPVLADGKLVIHQGNLTALNAATGETVWTAPSKARWGSPIVVRVGDEEVIVTAAGDFVRAADGKVLAADVASLNYCAPMAYGDVVYFIQNGGKAVRLPKTTAEPFALETLWTTEPPKDRYYASPVWVDGLVYAIMQKGVLSAIDAADGSVVYSKNLPLKGTTYPSVTLAGGLLYVSGEKGNTIVFKPGRAFEPVAENEIDPFRGSPVFVGKRLYLRTMPALYAIGE